MYKGQSGMWSWLFHRVTGLALLLFLCIHIVDISLLSFGPTVYNDGIRLFDLVVVRLLSLALVAAVFYHAFNGIRIIVIDFWKKGVRYQQVMFAIVLAITILVFIPMAFVILRPALASVAYWFIAIPGLTVAAGH
ncbi:MAG TPA: succinate dehydrogenase, cytochrome b556 subunit [Ktedonobacteraceae bacterium]|jgi:succinate dehydrogenase / fumarate reductase cytochrome b subunit|nr:succinate dehydrogenase, cytochrome b556 subunit [Ktedonobacteraceae bacterium]